MSTSRRYQVRLKPGLAGELQAFAELHDLSAVSAIRVLLRAGLGASGAGANEPDRAAVLACLTAAEHAVLMVASVLPEGKRRMTELAPRAAIAAAERLAAIQESEP